MYFLNACSASPIAPLGAVGVAHDVVGGREVGRDRGGAAILLDRLAVVLPAEVGPAEQEVGPLVLGILGHELLVVLELLGRIGVGAVLGA